MPAAIRQMTPHGGVLVDRVLRGVVREAALERAQSLPKVYLAPMAVSDLEMIAVGAFSPLTGFMDKLTYQTVLDDMRLPNGLAWTVPVTLPVTSEQAATLSEGQEIALVERTEAGADNIMGILQLAKKFGYDQPEEAEKVQRTTGSEDPVEARILPRGR